MEALDRESPEARAALLDRACAGDSALRAKVERMLVDHFLSDSFMAAPVAGEAPYRPTENSVTEQPGDQIGRYKLLEKLGEGGFGVVYMAEQRDPVKRRVALKIIKAGMDTREVVARFEAERQALAVMDHPHIAKIHDAGATDTGRPYFVMELVRGIRLTDYCDVQNLATPERLALFTQICQAVQHAHQKGIIHRDLKPSNILVTVNDGKPVPKIIDFGIAKATQMELTEKTVFTRFQQFLGTPAYMSPEQADLSSVDIDTRSDIYSLGVLLYELLTSKTPFDARELLKAGLDEMRRTIREKEPERPSTRVSTLRGEELTTTAKRRGLDAPKLIHVLRGDLDWIVMKCLEKDRARRYETANGLAADIQRHLNNEPVNARPPSAAYRLQKMVRRNKVAFGATAAVMVALLAGVTFSTWSFVRERDARRQAAVAAAKSETVAKFHQGMIQSMRPSIALGRDTTLLREFADRTLAQLSTNFQSQPLVAIELRATLGRVFLALGDYRTAEALYAETLPQARGLLGREHPDVAGMLQNYSEVLHGLGKFPEAEAMAREALAFHRKLRGEQHPDVAYSLMLVGNALRSEATTRKKLDQAESCLRRSLDIYQKYYGPEHRDVAMVLNRLAKVLEMQGRPQKAEQMYREALALAKRVLGEVDPDVVMMTEDLAGFLFARGDFTQWETMTRELLSTQRKLLGDENRHVANTLAELAGALITQRRFPEGESLMRDALVLHRRLYGGEHISVARATHTLGIALANQDRHAEAEPLLRDGLAMARKLLPQEDPIVGLGIENLGITLAAQEKYAEAEQLFREELTLARNAADSGKPKRAFASSVRTNPEPAYVVVILSRSHSSPTLVGALGNLADVLYRQGKYREAEALYRERIQLLGSKRSSEDKDVDGAPASLGRLLADWAWAERRQGAVVLSRTDSDRPSEPANRSKPRPLSGAPRGDSRTPVDLAREGELRLREALVSRLERTNATPWKTIEWKSRLGAALVSVAATEPDVSSETRAARLAEAEALLLEGNEAVQERPPTDNKYKRDTLERLVRLYETWNKPDEAADWRLKLKRFEVMKAEKKSASAEEGNAR